jgi:hypothetical protein
MEELQTTGQPLTTIKHTCGDTAEQVDDITGFVRQYNGKNVVGLLITCETNPIRFSWGADPTQAGLGHVLAVGASLKLTNHKQIIDFRFINQNNGSNAILQVTPEISTK